MFEYDPRTGELFNADRAKAAELALDQFGLLMFGGRSFAMLAKDGTSKDSDAYCAVLDLVTNLGHLCDRYGWDFPNLLTNAIRNHADEVSIEKMAGEG